MERCPLLVDAHFNRDMFCRDFLKRLCLKEAPTFERCVPIVRDVIIKDVHF